MGNVLKKVLKFQKEMIDIAMELELKNNWCVLQPVFSNKPLNDNEKEIVAQIHYKKIDISDAIYIVNIDGYIGESVKEEIAYAKAHGKEIIYKEKPNEKV